MLTPIKLSSYPQVGNFFTAFALVSLTSSVSANFSGEYSTGEAWSRTLIDAGVVFGSIAFITCGGWAAVGIGLGVGVGAEVTKYGINIAFKKYHQ